MYGILRKSNRSIPYEGRKSNKGGRVDYCLTIHKKNEIFIEVKKPGEDLEKHQEQLLDYSFREGIDLAILSNGTLWWFYLPRKRGHWRERKFYVIDLINQGPIEVIEKLVQLLSKNNVQSGEALRNAECIHLEMNKRKKAKETIPKAWNDIISSYNNTLIDLISETTEFMCAFRPEIEDIKDMINNFKESLLLPETAAYIPKPNKKCSMLKDRKQIKNQNQDQQFQQKIDVIMKFIAEKCLSGNEFKITAGELYKAYSDWAKDNGLQKIQRLSISKRSLGLMLAEQGFQKSKGTGGVRLWLGIALR